MHSKKDLEELLNSLIETGIFSKKEVIDIFIEVLRKNFSINEMFSIVTSTYENEGVSQKKRKDLPTDEIMSYPSVVGIPVSLVYEKLFKK